MDEKQFFEFTVKNNLINSDDFILKIKKVFEFFKNVVLYQFEYIFILLLFNYS